MGVKTLFFFKICQIEWPEADFACGCAAGRRAGMLRECQQADNQQKLLGAVRQKRRLHTEPRRQQPRHDA
ncbi:MAG: hypothetical protein ACLU3I_06070 [Acutalibacteraceae bacterium]